ncbi:MAG: phospholipase D family protein [Proteobacteria bacterium]|nr:phospholipase D family protein [Pseudomonadota bacterium]
MKKTLVLIILTLNLVACTISKETILKVQKVTALKKDQNINCPLSSENRCAIDSPFSDIFKQAKTDKQNAVVLLDKGEESLLARVHLIKAAEYSINIQVFIWVNDEAGNLMLRELLLAAKRGVKVNIIIDQLFSMGSSWFLAELATLHHNINFKLFNPVFREAHTSPLDFFTALDCCLAKTHRRMHNKVFVVDDKYGIVGGRNYQSRYYDWDPVFNYKDRDIIAIGSVVSQMTESFQAFWDSEFVVPVELLDDVSMRILNNQETQHIWDLPYENKQRKLIEAAYDYTHVESVLLPDLTWVKHIEFYSDTPDKPFNKTSRMANKQLTNKIRRLIDSTSEHLLIQTPYLVFSRKARKSFKKLRKKNPDMVFEVSTNSLASTDAYYVYAISYKHKRFYLKKLGMHLYEYKDRPGMLDQHFASGVINQKTRFGMHGKSFVIDNKISMIGSHNFDPRSDSLNTEAGLIITSVEFANKLSKNIRLDMLDENSWVVAAKEQIPLLSDLSGVLATISRSLPIFDIWPFRYSTSYKLRPGFSPVAPNHPDFYKNYEPIGNFPNVNLSSKQIQTIIISAFAGFAEPVM